MSKKTIAAAFVLTSAVGIAASLLSTRNAPRGWRVVDPSQPAPVDGAAPAPAFAPAPVSQTVPDGSSVKPVLDGGFHARVKDYVASFENEPEVKTPAPLVEGGFHARVENYLDLLSNRPETASPAPKSSPPAEPDSSGWFDAEGPQTHKVSMSKPLEDTDQGETVQEERVLALVAAEPLPAEQVAMAETLPASATTTPVTVAGVSTPARAASGIFDPFIIPSAGTFSSVSHERASNTTTVLLCLLGIVAGLAAGLFRLDPFDSILLFSAAAAGVAFVVTLLSHLIRNRYLNHRNTEQLLTVLVIATLLTGLFTAGAYRVTIAPLF